MAKHARRKHSPAFMAKVAVPRSSASARSQGVSDTDVELMRQLDELYFKWPFYGSRRLRDALRQKGRRLNPKRIQRLMRQLGLRGSTRSRVRVNPTKGTKSFPTCCES